MDIFTLIGFLIGFGMVLSPIILGGDPHVFLDLPSVVIVVGGTFASIFATFPFEEVLQAIKSAGKVLFYKKKDLAEMVETMVSIADLSRREGLLGLEKVQTDNVILKKACQLISDNAKAELIAKTVEIEILSMRRRHNISINIFAKLGSFAPAFGMIGTLVGLVQMLSNLSNPETLGPAMAVAILTTFYGSFLANLIFIPLSGKLRSRSLQEELVLLIIFEGAKSILDNNSPQLVYEQLSSFLPQSERTDNDK
ncbi:MAG: motility protein A [Desulfovibrionaceae bacterium]